jgi:hypothetical protein
MVDVWGDSICDVSCCVVDGGWEFPAAMYSEFLGVTVRRQ